ncbi:MAG: DsbA family protein [Burkholderiales bacterium]
MKQKTLFVGSTILLLLVFVVGTLLYKSEKADQTTSAVNANASALVRFHSPTLGTPDAKVHIVEFLDPACETCAAFYPFIKKMMAANPDRIRLSVRYAPFHKGSDEVVKALEAARKQGKYWEALEALLASQPQWAQNHTAQVNLVWQPLARAGVNVEQAKNDMQAPDIARIIAQDVEDGRALNVNKTPEFFVNGRPLPSFGYEQLRTLVQDEIAKAYR